MKTPSRKAKIVATLGPSSSDTETIANLIKAGVNVFRLNFSHGKLEDHKKRCEQIRESAKKLGKSIAVLQDLQGPKLRVGSFEDGSIALEKGEDVVFTLESNRDQKVKQASGKIKQIPYNVSVLAKTIQVRHRILLDDGNMECVVTKIDGSQIYAQVVFGGTLKDKKGMNFPDTKLLIDSFTEQDKEHLLFGMSIAVDYVALSFVRSAEDILKAKRFMHKHKMNIPIVAKIEKAEAIDSLLEILKVTDAVMVARGDLAVETGTALVPSYQKQIIHECRVRGIPVITATQMLESMIHSPRPTRAEASDVANAVIDGSDALMLSAESASGKFPVLAVSVMHNIIHETEQRLQESFKNHSRISEERFKKIGFSVVDAIEQSAAHIANIVSAKCITCTTHTGRAAKSLAQFRPELPIMAYTDNPRTERELALVWGIESHSVPSGLQLEALTETIEKDLAAKGIVEKNDLFVFTAGWPPLKYGTTNFLRVIQVKQDAAKISKKETSNKAAAKEENITGYRSKQAQFIIDQSLCIQCGGCIEVCPNDIFGSHQRRVFLKESNCKNCTFDNACMEICPTNAIEIIRLKDS